MASKVRTRVGVTVAGAFRQLFAIRDRGSAGPVVYFTEGGLLDDPIGGDLRIAARHLSFHPCLKSHVPNLMDLSYTIDTESGQVADGHAKFVISSRNDCWIIFGARAHDVSPDKYIKDIKDKDETIILAEFNSPANSIVYYIVAAHPDISEVELAQIGFQFKILRYEPVAIVIVYAFMGIVPLPGGSTVACLTNSVRENYVHHADLGENIVRPHSVEGLRESILFRHKVIVGHTLRKMDEWIDEVGRSSIPDDTLRYMYEGCCRLYEHPMSLDG